jgi:hypothetical protein
VEDPLQNDNDPEIEGAAGLGLTVIVITLELTVAEVGHVTLDVSVQ